MQDSEYNLVKYSIMSLGGKNMDDDKFNRLPPISVKDQIFTIWGFTAGLYCIFYKGTYVVFSSWPGTQQSNQDLLDAWQKMGRYDTQHLHADPNLVAICTVLSVVVGPLLLMYSWAIVEK
jgi:hypothetical protein